MSIDSVHRNDFSDDGQGRQNAMATHQQQQQQQQQQSGAKGGGGSSGLTTTEGGVDNVTWGRSGQPQRGQHAPQSFGDGGGSNNTNNPDGAGDMQGERSRGRRRGDGGEYSHPPSDGGGGAYSPGKGQRQEEMTSESPWHNDSNNNDNNSQGRLQGENAVGSMLSRQQQARGRTGYDEPGTGRASPRYQHDGGRENPRPPSPGGTPGGGGGGGGGRDGSGAGSHLNAAPQHLPPSPRSRDRDGRYPDSSQGRHPRSSLPGEDQRSDSDDNDSDNEARRRRAENHGDGPAARAHGKAGGGTRGDVAADGNDDAETSNGQQQQQRRRRGQDDRHGSASMVVNGVTALVKTAGGLQQQRQTNEDGNSRKTANSGNGRGDPRVEDKLAPAPAGRAIGGGSGRGGASSSSRPASPSTAAAAPETTGAQKTLLSIHGVTSNLNMPLNAPDVVVVAAQAGSLARSAAAEEEENGPETNGAARQGDPDRKRTKKNGEDGAGAGGKTDGRAGGGEEEEEEEDEGERDPSGMNESQQRALQAFLRGADETQANLAFVALRKEPYLVEEFDYLADQIEDLHEATNGPVPRHLSHGELRNRFRELSARSAPLLRRVRARYRRLQVRWASQLLGALSTRGLHGGDADVSLTCSLCGYDWRRAEPRSNQRRPAFPGMKRGNTPGRVRGRRRWYPDPAKRHHPEHNSSNNNEILGGAKGFGDNRQSGVDSAGLVPSGVVLVPGTDAGVDQNATNGNTFSPQGAGLAAGAGQSGIFLSQEALLLHSQSAPAMETLSPTCQRDSIGILLPTNNNSTQHGTSDGGRRSYKTAVTLPCL